MTNNLTFPANFYPQVLQGINFDDTYSANVTRNTTIIQAALDAGGIVNLDSSVAQTIWINAPLIVKSNTVFKWGKNITIKLKGGINDSVIFTNAFYDYWRNNNFGTIVSLTAALTTTFTNIVTMRVVSTAYSARLSVGSYVAVLHCGIKGYGGVHQILSVDTVSDPGFTIFTYNADAKPSATTGTLSATAYMPDGTGHTTAANAMHYLVADENITIDGGILDYNAYDSVNNTTGNTTVWNGTPVNGTSSCSGIFAAYANRLNVALHSAINIGGRAFCGFNLRNYEVNIKNIDNSAVAVQMLAPLYNGRVHGSVSDGMPLRYGSRGIRDDGVALMNKEDTVGFAIEAWSEGDVINIELANNAIQTNIANSCAIYAFTSLYYYMGVRIKRLAGGSDNKGNFNGAIYTPTAYNGFGLLIGGGTTQLGTINDLELDGQNQSCLVQDVVTSNVTIDRLMLKNINYTRSKFYSSGTSAPSIRLGTNTVIKEMVIDGLDFPSPFLAQSSADFYMEVASTATSVGSLVFNNINFVDGNGLGYGPYFLKVNKSMDTIVFNNCNFNGSVAVLIPAGVTVQTLVFENCNANNGAYYIAEITGTVQNLVLNGGYYDTAQAAVKVNNTGTVNALRGTMPRLGASAFNGLITFSGLPTIRCYSPNAVLDVGLLSGQQGQICTHSSIVAGRNAAAQQGPAVSTGSNHWYAIGTGASGVNTLIV